MSTASSTATTSSTTSSTASASDGTATTSTASPLATGSLLSSTPAISAVTIKLPPFWPADPEVWFAQVEAQFTTRRIIAQKTRFDYVVSSLSPEFATEVRDLLLKPPTITPYDKLKEQLIKRTAASEQRKLQQLISGEELGDRKPTQLLRRMQQLLGEQLGSSPDAKNLVRELFLQRLPDSVRMILASADAATVDVDKLADMADKIIDVAGGRAPSISAIHSNRSGYSEEVQADIKELRLEVSRLTELVSSLSTRPRERKRSLSRPRRPPTPTPDSHPLCWYHHKFGEAAKKCQEPCSWGNSPAGR